MNIVFCCFLPSFLWQSHSFVRWLLDQKIKLPYPLNMTCLVSFRSNFEINHLSWPEHSLYLREYHLNGWWKFSNLLVITLSQVKEILPSYEFYLRTERIIIFHIKKGICSLLQMHRVSLILKISKGMHSCTNCHDHSEREQRTPFWSRILAPKRVWIMRKKTISSFNPVSSRETGLHILYKQIKLHQRNRVIHFPE